MLGFSHSLLFMFLSRIPTGLLKHTQAIIKAYMADVTPREDRPAALGTLNALCTSGFIVGPLIGGNIAMTENGFHRVAWLSGLIFFINGFFVAYIIPDAVEQPWSSNGSDGPNGDVDCAVEKPPGREVASSEGKEALARADKAVSAVAKDEAAPASNPISAFFKSVQDVSWTDIVDIFLIRFLTTLAMIVFRSSFSVVLEYRHGTTQKTNGYLTSFNAILGVLGGASVGRIAQFFPSSETMHRFFSVTLVLSLGFISAAPSMTYVIIGLAPLCISTAVLRVTSATAMYNRGGEKEKGLLTGLGDSITSMARTIGPTIGGIAQDVNIYGPGIVSTMLAIAGTSLSFIFDMGKYKTNFKNKGQ